MTEQAGLQTPAIIDPAIPRQAHRAEFDAVTEQSHGPPAVMGSDQRLQCLSVGHRSPLFRPRRRAPGAHDQTTPFWRVFGRGADGPGAAGALPVPVEEPGGRTTAGPGANSGARADRSPHPGASSAADWMIRVAPPG